MVPLKEGEEARSWIMQLGLLDLDHRIQREGDHLLIPVTGDGDIGYPLTEAELEPVKRRETDYRSLLRLDPELMEVLPSSFDVIGDVGIVRLDDALIPHAQGIAEAMRGVLPHLKAVAVDRGVSGEMRVRQLELVSGEALETMHTEYGVRLHVDPSVAYFNPRLAIERRRIASLVREGEVVINMFAGVGPFPLMIDRHASPSEVYAIDLNPEAHRLMVRNVELNHARTVKPVLGDARSEILRLPMADRIIMNLPHSAHEFIPYAVPRLKDGGMIHLHLICERDDADRVVERVLGSSPRPLRVNRMKEMKSYSPTMGVYAVDLVIA